LLVFISDATTKAPDHQGAVRITMESCPPSFFLSMIFGAGDLPVPSENSVRM
jgi:hypothetical protein